MHVLEHLFYLEILSSFLFPICILTELRIWTYKERISRKQTAKCVLINRPGPNSPLGWVKRCVEAFAPGETEKTRALRLKLLIGIPFYGYDFLPGDTRPVTGNEYAEYLILALATLLLIQRSSHKICTLSTKPQFWNHEHIFKFL